MRENGKAPEMLRMAVTLLGVPYLWWAKGEEYGGVYGGKFETRPVRSVVGGNEAPALAFDCSGFVTWLHKQATGADLRWTHNTDKLWNELPGAHLATDGVPSRGTAWAVLPGDLAFYGGGKPDDVSHVMLVLSVMPEGVMVLGASGGDSSTTSPKPRARVKLYSSHLYRRDFRGFRVGLLRAGTSGLGGAGA